MDALHVVAKRLTMHPAFRASPLVVKGGTGLALGYGLPRPSTDLDVTCSGKASKERVLAAALDALSQASGRTFLRADVKQRGRGFVRLQWEDEGDGMKVRIDTKIDVNTEDPVAIPANTVMRNGFRTFSLGAIAESKLNTLVGERARTQARDLFDAAWLMERHMDAVPPEQRLCLSALVSGPILDAFTEWSALFKRDDIMSKSSFDEVWESLEANLSCDPVVLFHQFPDGGLSFDEREGRHILLFSGGVYDGHEIGHFESSEAALAWLGRVDPDRTLPAPTMTPSYTSDWDSGSPSGP